VFSVEEDTEDCRQKSLHLTRVVVLKQFNKWVPHSIKQQEDNVGTWNEVIVARFKEMSLKGRKMKAVVFSWSTKDREHLRQAETLRGRAGGGMGRGERSERGDTVEER
jgi:hypothetical protein